MFKIKFIGTLLALTFAACSAQAQITNPGVQQSGSVTPGNLAVWGPGVGQISDGGGVPSVPVTSVFGRTGTVVAQSNDYNFNQIAGNWTLAQGPVIGANTVLGSIAGGVPAALTTTQATTLCDVFTSALKGCVPASGGGTTNYLRADGTWDAPTGGAVSSVFGRTGAVVAQTNDYNFNQLAGTAVTSQGGVGRNASADLVNTVSVADGAGNTVATAIMSLINTACSTALTRPACISFFNYADVRWFGAVCNNSGNQATAIQAAIDYMATTFNGGNVNMPNGVCLVTGGVVLKESVVLAGAGRNSSALYGSGAITPLVLDATCEYCGVTNLFVNGQQSASAAQPAVTVLFPAKFRFENCYIWGGSYALSTAGFDGRMYNCDVQAANTAGVGVYSTGANFYTDSKIDNIGAGFAGFYQAVCAAALCENQIVNTDFSGNPYTHAIYIADGGLATAATKIVGGIFGGPVTMAAGKVLLLTAGEFNGAITNTAGAMTISSSYAFSATTATGAGARSCAANINITC